MNSKVLALASCFIAYLTVSVHFDAKAQQLYTLQQCIELALNNNVQVKQAELNSQLNHVNLNQSKANLLPNVNGQGGNFYNVGRTIDRFTNQFANTTVQSMNFGVSGQLTVFNGLQNYNTIKQNEINEEVGKQDLNRSKNDVALNIANAFLQVLLNKQILVSARQQVAQSEKLILQTKKLVDAGTVPRGNLLQAEAQLATEELAVVNAQNAVDIALLNLALLINLKTTESFDVLAPEIPNPEQMPLLINSTNIYSMALQNQPSIKAAQLRVQSSDKGLLLAKGARYPTLGISGSYGTGYSGLAQRVIGTTLVTQPIGVTETGELVYSSFAQPITERSPYNQQFKDNVNKSYGIAMSIPIFNNLQIHSQVERAKIQQEQARLNLQQEEINLQRQVQQAYADAVAAFKRFKATQKSVEALAEFFKYAEDRYNNGVMNSLEYNDNKTRLMRAEQDLLQAKYDYVFRMKVLDFYQGKPIVL
jgi:outer membrane protein